MNKTFQFELFRSTLKGQYEILFKNDPEYNYSKSKITPEALADKMTNALLTGDANKDGKGIKNTCKILNIPCTYKGIQDYLK